MGWFMDLLKGKKSVPKWKHKQEARHKLFQVEQALEEEKRRQDHEERAKQREKEQEQSIQNVPACTPCILEPPYVEPKTRIKLKTKPVPKPENTNGYDKYGVKTLQFKIDLPKGVSLSKGDYRW